MEQENLDQMMIAALKRDLIEMTRQRDAAIAAAVHASAQRDKAILLAQDAVRDHERTLDGVQRVVKDMRTR